MKTVRFNVHDHFISKNEKDRKAAVQQKMKEYLELHPDIRAQNQPDVRCKGEDRKEETI